MSTPALLPQKEQDSLGLQSHEYRIKIGQVACDIQIVSDRVIHCSVNESLGTAEGQLPITVSKQCRRWRWPWPPALPHLLECQPLLHMPCRCQALCSVDEARGAKQSFTSPLDRGGPST